MRFQVLGYRALRWRGGNGGCRGFRIILSAQLYALGFRAEDLDDYMGVSEIRGTLLWVRVLY